ncbi:MAG: hypothetical protein ACLRWH_00155 [Emergencia sp.]
MEKGSGQKKMDNNTFDMMKKYAEELAELPGTDRGAWRIMVNLDGRIYETAEGCDLSDLKRGDVAIVEGGSKDYPVERGLLLERGESKALVLSKTTFCTLAAKKNMKLVPALDDMAQIVGPQAETVDYEEKKIRKALKKSTGCFVKDRYTISTGRSLFEAVTALKVLEKSAEINIKAQVLGGPVPVARAEARLMRQIYKRKYSKSEAAVKAKEGRA